MKAADYWLVVGGTFVIMGIIYYMGGAPAAAYGSWMFSILFGFKAVTEVMKNED